MMSSRCSICNNKKSTFTAEPSALACSSSERIPQGSGIFDNTNRDRIKDALLKAFR